MFGASLCRWSKPQTNCIIISFGWHFNLISFAQQLSSSLRFVFFLFFFSIRLSFCFVCTFPPIAHIFAPFTEFFPQFAHFRLRLEADFICAGEAFFIFCVAAAYNVIISFCAWPFNWRKLKRENIFATVPTERGGTLCRRRWQSQLWQLIRKRDFIFIIIRPTERERVLYREKASKA